MKYSTRVCHGVMKNAAILKEKIKGQFIGSERERPEVIALGKPQC